MKKYILPFILALVGIASADRYEYVSEVDREIPDNDSTGIRDTIFIDQHILIEDINIYVGIGRPNTPWAEHVLIDIFSPSRARVRLNDWGGVHISWYNCWYDTEREEDGPGELEDYAGSDAYGYWEMFCFDPFEDYTLFWYSWRIEVIGTPIVGLAEEKGPLPTEFEFSGVYPNPFNSTVSLEYGLPKPSEVIFTVYDVQGRKVKVIKCGSMSAGYHNVIWDGANSGGAPVASGVYFIRIAADRRKFTRNAVMLK
jgi:subtilisin-like proprotein convertase family protein